MLPKLKVILACPRGFCAGVTRAIKIVETALEKYGKPVYVRHEIVHNEFVVKSLEDKGAIFVDELDDIPDNYPVIFSAHGVPKSVKAEANRRNMISIDATCPLVNKVHKEAEKNLEKGYHTILIGHAKHPEVIGTMGQVPPEQITLIETIDDAISINLPSDKTLGYVTQTTLSLDETKEIVEILKSRFPNLVAPRQDDICYATTNRQKAVKKIAPMCDAIMVLGSPKSSNSKRLVEVAANEGCPESYLIKRADDINWHDIAKLKVLGITAGASAPEILINEVIEEAKKHFTIEIEEIIESEEKTIFKLPEELL